MCSIAISLVIGMMIWYHITPTWAVLTLPLFVLFTMATALAAGLWLSALNVQYRDLARNRHDDLVSHHAHMGCSDPTSIRTVHDGDRPGGWTVAFGVECAVSRCAPHADVHRAVLAVCLTRRLPKHFGSRKVAATVRTQSHGRRHRRFPLGAAAEGPSPR